MVSKPVPIALLLVLGIACAAQSQPRTQPPRAPPIGAPTFQKAPPAPAFKVGTTIIDRTGAALGAIKGVSEDANGDMSIVVQIDGKLISIPESALRLQGERVVSARSKSELLAGARVRR